MSDNGGRIAPQWMSSSVLESPRCPVTFHGSGKIQRLQIESGNAWCAYCSLT